MPAYQSTNWHGRNNNNHYWSSWHGYGHERRWTPDYYRDDHVPPPKKPRIEKSEDVMPIEKQMCAEELAALRKILFGEMLEENDLERWEQQSFEFCKDKGPVWGLTQRHGGPCGVLASVQGFILREVFSELKHDVCCRGVEFSSISNSSHMRDGPLACCFWLRGRCPYGSRCKYAHVSDANGTENSACQYGARCRYGHHPAQDRFDEKDARKSSKGDVFTVLARALTAMLKNALPEGTSTFWLVKWGPAQEGSRTDSASRLVHTVSLSSADQVLSWLTAEGGKQIRQPGAVLSFVASLLLTRTLTTVQNDMDDPGQHMITTFGHCSQELMNLCLTGKATSNVHDGNITIGEDGEDCIILKGIEQPPTIGYLSAFEALNQLEVGRCYKQPKWPIWVIGGPMHYTICFSPDCTLNHVQLPDESKVSGGDGVKRSKVAALENCEVCGVCLAGSKGTLPSVSQLQNGYGTLYHFNGLEQKVAETGQAIRCPELRKCYVSASNSACTLASSDEDPELFQVLLRSRWHSVDVSWDGDKNTKPPRLN